MSLFARRPSSLLLTTGALGIAGTTALEVVTAPYSSTVAAYSLNGPVHVAKVVSVVVLVVGLAGLVGFLRGARERLAAAAAGTLAVATMAGAVPYSVVEATLDPGFAPAAADARLEQIHLEQAWIGTTASIALPLVVLAVLVLAVAVLRRRVLPTWAPIASLTAVPVAVVAGVLGEAGWVLPHPPAWLFLGVAAYGPALARAAAPAERTERVALPV